MTLEQACPSECQRAQYAFKDSMTHGFCNSHYLSHFAAFFIDARTKRSVVESFKSIPTQSQTRHVFTKGSHGPLTGANQGAPRGYAVGTPVRPAWVRWTRPAE